MIERVREKNVFMAGRNNVKDRSKILINKNTLSFMLLILLNLLPDELFHSLTIYKSETPSFIRYKWLNYSFGIIDLLILLYGIILSKIHKRRWFWISAGILVFREIIFFALSDFSVISEGRYEIFLTILVGIALIQLQLNLGETTEDVWHKFQIIMLVNVFSVFLNLTFQRSGLIGRYNAVNLDVGTTGVIAGITLIGMSLDSNFKYHILWAIIAGIALILSGSRINVLISIASCLILFVIRIGGRLSSRKTLHVKLSTIVIFIFLIIILLVCGQELMQELYSSRIMTVFYSQNIKNALSGRPASLNAGLNIIIKKPLGISSHFANLQLKTIQEGFETFPHFGLLVQYIFFGPLIIIPLYYLIKSTTLLFRQKKLKILFPILYLIIYNIVGGGPIVNSKIIYLFGSIFVIGYMSARKVILADKLILFQSKGD